MAEAVISFLVGRLGDLLTEDAGALNKLSDQVEEVQAGLMSLQDHLKEAKGRQNEGLIQAWIADVRELAYDASNVFETFVLQVTSKKKNIVKRFVNSDNNIESKIQTINKRIYELLTRLPKVRLRSFSQGESSGASTSRGIDQFSLNFSIGVIDEEVIGLTEDINMLVARLSQDGLNESVLAIYGMGGLGKTTLARKIYNHVTTKRHFACLAWVYISRKWKRDAILKEILYKLSSERRNAIINLSEEELVNQIFEIQNTKRCLVVLDDIWSTEAWDCLKAAFPTKSMSGNILVTTRNKTIAEHVANRQGFLHQPQLLNGKQSLELLLKKTCIRSYEGNLQFPLVRYIFALLVY